MWKNCKMNDIRKILTFFQLIVFALAENSKIQKDHSKNIGKCSIAQLNFEFMISISSCIFIADFQLKNSNEKNQKDQSFYVEILKKFFKQNSLGLFWNFFLITIYLLKKVICFGLR